MTDNMFEQLIKIYELKTGFEVYRHSKDEFEKIYNYENTFLRFYYEEFVGSRAFYAIEDLFIVFSKSKKYLASEIARVKNENPDNLNIELLIGFICLEALETASIKTASIKTAGGKSASRGNKKSEKYNSDKLGEFLKSKGCTKSKQSKSKSKKVKP